MGRIPFLGIVLILMAVGRSLYINMLTANASVYSLQHMSEDITSWLVFGIGVVAVYGRLILNKMDDARTGANQPLPIVNIGDAPSDSSRQSSPTPQTAS